MSDAKQEQNVLRDGVTEPARRGDERMTLMGLLQQERDLVAWRVRDVPDAVLRSVSTSTGLTLHGIVRHLTNVERYWFREVFAGKTDLPYDWTDDDPDGEFHVPADVTMASLLDAYARETALCDGVITAAPLDAVSVKRAASLRWIVLHMIEETARHLGQMDLLREQADGATGYRPGSPMVEPSQR